MWLHVKLEISNKTIIVDFSIKKKLNICTDFLESKNVLDRNSNFNLNFSGIHSPELNSRSKNMAQFISVACIL